MKNETDNQRWFLVLFLMKVALDLAVLQSLCLMPPKGVKLEQWQCIMGHCNSSSDSLRIQNAEVLGKLQKIVKKKMDSTKISIKTTKESGAV